MAANIRFAESIEDEHVRIGDCYEQRRPGLGCEYVRRVNLSIGKISDSLTGHAVYGRQYRWAGVEKFSYIIVYGHDPT